MCSGVQYLLRLHEIPIQNARQRRGIERGDRKGTGRKGGREGKESETAAGGGTHLDFQHSKGGATEVSSACPT